MARAKPDISVVVGTHNRAARLRDLLAGLEAQTLPPERFEVIVVDDASTDETPQVLASASEGALVVRAVRRDVNGGWAAAKQDGWRLAQAAIIAFTDDDCVPEPDWLEAGLRAASENPGAIVQGRTDPIAAELDAVPPAERPFTRTIHVPEPDPAFQTCNVFYPRDLLERLDGFDVEGFGRSPGEDADVAWRAIDAGAATAFAADARVAHAVNRLGPAGKLRHAAGWDMRVYARHPGLRRAHFYRYGIFWKRSHFWLSRALLGLLVPRRLWPIRVFLAYRYGRNVWARAKSDRVGLRLAPWYVAYDLVEMATVIRSAIRYRTPMI
jgi:GT2 family glycosyltransferase